MRKREFLTDETTSASEMLEKTPCEIFCQKRPPAAVHIAGMWPGMAMPPPPLAAG
jgi:hypothetical protein